MNNTPLSPPDMTQTLIAAGYLLLIAAAAYFVIRFLGNRSNQSAQIKILQRVAFARDKSVMLIKAGTRYLLIGVSSQQLTLLTELDKDELLPEESDPQSFKSVFNRARDSGGESGDDNGDNVNGNDSGKGGDEQWRKK